MFVLYRVLALLGGAGTYFNIQSARAGEQYPAGWFANSVSSSAAVDITVVAVIACLGITLESRSQGMKVWLASGLVSLSIVIAISFTFPLSLAWPRWHVARAMISADAAGTA